MFLYEVVPDPRSRDARRDLADPYQMHATLSRAFSEPESKCAAGEFLWRQEAWVGHYGRFRLLVQSRSRAKWEHLPHSWLERKPREGISVVDSLSPGSNLEGSLYRFRLRANPSICKNGKRIGLMKQVEYDAWLIRQGTQHGFQVLSSCPSQELLVTARQHSGNSISAFTVLFDGVLAVVDPHRFLNALSNGIGRAKALGLGLLSVHPLDVWITAAHERSVDSLRDGA
jgi:CRISPR system Cascade subunit CasE